ncbi:protein kinase [Streptomyces naganishii]|uniref:Serine/threonine protein kinase n=1 Tax=Streptomyces naganishii JCM 4654 TaxID=1306179 RepID=A0A919CXM3_9ACTN|nr:protein kinase [Streptomyces naganishii]GHD94478.1 serine/threonine protein kinase [Streptomyces naganishii JCM 4654]
MDDYAGRVLAGRYRLPLPPSHEYELTESRAFDTYSGQEVLVRQVPLPEVVEAEVLDADGLPEGFTGRTAARRPTDPAVRRAVEAAQAAARIPDHPRLDQVFDVFAEGGSLWIVSELVAARPLAALLAEKPLTPYRAAEVASDLLMALRVLHAHGWVHRNITARTVLVCDDGRVMLTGLAVGAAEEALCGYDPVPAEDGEGTPVPPPPPANGTGGGTGLGAGSAEADPEAARRAAIEARAAGALPLPGTEPGGAAGAPGPAGAPARRAPVSGEDVRAARAGAIAAYRAGARAAARVQEAQQSARAALPGARQPGTGERPSDRLAEPSYGTVTGPGDRGRTAPPGRIADPYGVRPAQWNGTGSRPGTEDPQQPGRLGGGQGRAALPGGTPLPGSASTDAGRAAVPGSGTTDGSRTAFPGSGATDGGRTALSGPVAQEGARMALPASEPGGAVPPPARWDDLAAGAPVRRGPATALAAERARQARMAVVGPVTERWAPEQAGPVHENWQLAAPIGPATDLWALGALLFKAVQGHAPYPEESTAELVQMVCAEPPAFAEECGPLRPVVESLLRQDPTERLDFEELSGWLRSLVRSAPEPEAGAHVVAAPPADPNRLPVIRRRGELVRRRRAGLPAHHGRHKRTAAQARSPRSLGRTLLLLILLLLAAAVAYAMLFMPKSGGGGAAGADRARTAGEASPAPTSTGRGSGNGGDTNGTSQASGSPETQTSGPDAGSGFTLREDPAGFRVAVAKGWTRTPGNADRQVVYSQGDFELIVVPGRDSVARFGSDPMVYQREKEAELQGYRSSSWATSSGLRTIQVGGRTMAEGQFTWTGADGRQLFVRNLAVLIDGRYHVVQVRGPEAQRDRVTQLYEQASATYQYTG